MKVLVYSVISSAEPLIGCMLRYVSVSKTHLNYSCLNSKYVGVPALWNLITAYGVAFQGYDTILFLSSICANGTLASM